MKTKSLGLLSQDTSSQSIAPTRIRLETSTVCQLRCPSCPTASGEIGRQLGSGFLSLEQFRKFVDDHAQLRSIELSNWGELFLNREIQGILQYAHEQGVELTASNGVNLNLVSPEVLKAIVKFGLRSLNCSIDGASQEIYARYRVKGCFETVINNIREINRWKQHYKSAFPVLNWQYIAFAHNEHEIGKARRLAEALDMTFSLKLSWGDLYGEAFSPVRDKDLIRRESGLGVADRDEFRKRYGLEYAGREVCLEMWSNPQVNVDGRLLGCAINYWDDYGNVFEQGLHATVNSERARYARQMLMGRKEAIAEIPCSHCRMYANMRETGQWIREQDIEHIEQGLQAGYIATPSRSTLPSRGYALAIDREALPHEPWKPRIVFRGASTAFDFLQCHQSSLVPGHIPHSPHAHADEELLVLLSGEAELIIPEGHAGEASHRLPVKAGDFVYYPAQFAHTLQATGWEPANYLMFKWENARARSESVLPHQYFSCCELLQQMEGSQGFNVRVLFEGQTDHLKKLHCHLSVLTVGAGYAEHADDYDVAIIMLEGEVDTLGGRFGPYSVIYCARGEPHGMHNPGPFDAKYIVFEFHP